MLRLARRLFLGSQVWLKEHKEELLSDDDKRRVAERNKRNAEIFGHETMEEDIKRLRVHLAMFITRACLPLIATQSGSPAFPPGDHGLLPQRLDCHLCTTRKPWTQLPCEN